MSVYKELTEQGCNTAKKDNGDCKTPMVLEFLIDGRILRDQARICHAHFGGNLK